MCGVGVHVYPTIEHGSSVFADAAVDHRFPSGVLLDELAHIVNDARDGDEPAAVLGLVLEVVPFHDWKGVERHTPIEFGALLVELLLLLLHPAFFDFVLFELFEVVR